MESKQKIEQEPARSSNPIAVDITDIDKKVKYLEEQLLNAMSVLDEHTRVIEKMKEITGYANVSVTPFENRNRNPDRLPIGGPVRSYHDDAKKG